MALESLQDLYLHELKDLYSAENQILKALPKMIKAATHPDLQEAFTDHLAKSRVHVERLEKICADLGESPKGKHCGGMEGVISEGAELIGKKPDASVLDAGLAAAAQHVEHYEMAGYGSVREWAEQLGHAAHVKLLQQTLNEEKEADALLSQLASTSLNPRADNEAAAKHGGPADMAPRSKTGPGGPPKSRSKSDGLPARDR